MREVGENFKFICDICKKEGFRKRGKKFYRVYGDGVLQILQYSKRSDPFFQEVVDIGLYSLYGEMPQRGLDGCYGMYNSRFLSKPQFEFIENNQNKSSLQMEDLENILVFHFYKQEFLEYTIPFLNRIHTQADLLDALQELYYRNCNQKPTDEESMRLWTDAIQYAPFLYERRYVEAKKVMETLLDLLIRDGSKNSDEEKKFKAMIALAEEAEPESIKAYLIDHFVQNSSLFPTRTKTHRTQADGSLC